MGIFDFRRCDGFVGSIPQQFINKNLPKCPMCGSTDPYWMLKDQIAMTEKRVLFRCSKCGCILSASQADFSGLSQNKAATVFTTAGSMNALFKKCSGKQVGTVYIKIEEVGEAQTTRYYEGKELPLAEIQKLANSL